MGIYAPTRTPDWKVRSLDIEPGDKVYKGLAPEGITEAASITMIPYRNGTGIGFTSVERDGYRDDFFCLLYCVGAKKVVGHVYNDPTHFLSAMDYAHGFLTAVEQFVKSPKPAPEKVIEELLAKSKKQFGTPYVEER